MYIKTAVITNKVGLHARPATFLIQKANEYSAGIWLEKDERRVNAKSLLGVLSLGVGQNEEIKIIGDGTDENEAVETIYNLITSDFEE
ncbi:MAG: HPr family phosphocarrier protein [Oscillospiraceae bacterium]|nr:HPr family phosphocarrier protein [Oscillospiraceae bacterium]